MEYVRSLSTLSRILYVENNLYIIRLWQEKVRI